ncbi:MAG: hypothetical protein M1813_002790 [Trichoglossum hirsutum]|jgi:hypothetical protein|nr:MAG: hypothetical protein M1813_002790 [Trichoglossum hirsutum]
MHFATIAAHILIAASLTNAVLLPTNPPNGLYISTVSSDGTVTTDHYGTDLSHAFKMLSVQRIGMNSSTPDNSSIPTNSSLPNSAKFKRFNTDVSCNGFSIGSLDRETAINGLASWFGYGQSYTAKHESYVWGSVVAFTCNYGKKQTYTSAQFLADNGQVDDVCGATGAGWMSWPQYKSSSGRTGSSQSFC